MDSTKFSIFLHSNLGGTSLSCSELENSKKQISLFCKSTDFTKNFIPTDHEEVIMGGGRQMFQSNATDKPGDPVDTWACRSLDGRDLIADWVKDKEKRGVSHAFVSNTKELDEMDDSTEFVLGIFSNGHLTRNYKRDRGPTGMPSLKSMTEKAIKILQKNPKGFVLMVEGGQIDVANHRGYAKQALNETAALSDAVEGALSLVDLKETLIIVTSDHSHSLSFVGYTDRKEGVFGMAQRPANRTQHTSLLYAVGGDNNFQYTVENSEPVRRDPASDKTDDFEYSQQTGIHSDEGEHSGTDVVCYATVQDSMSCELKRTSTSVHLPLNRCLPGDNVSVERGMNIFIPNFGLHCPDIKGAGPMSHLVRSVREQTFVAYLISYAAKIGPVKDVRNSAFNKKPTHSKSISVLILIATIIIYIRLLILR